MMDMEWKSEKIEEDWLKLSHFLGEAGLNYANLTSNMLSNSDFAMFNVLSLSYYTTDRS